MNDRIQELIEQCKETATTYFDGRGNVTETYFDKYKFAEMLVRECADVAGCNAHVSGFALSDLIKEHFGVNND